MLTLSAVRTLEYAFLESAQNFVIKYIRIHNRQWNYYASSHSAEYHKQE